jgi:nitrite reductase (NADH) small subunit
MEVFVAKSHEIEEGGRRALSHGEHDVAVVRVKGKLHALANVCPHQGGPVCEGMLIRKVEEVIAPDKTYQGMRFSETDVHIVCPWHGWEFNVETGRCAGDGKFGLRRYKVLEREGGVYVVL